MSHDQRRDAAVRRRPNNDAHPRRRREQCHARVRQSLQPVLQRADQRQRRRDKTGAGLLQLYNYYNSFTGNLTISQGAVQAGEGLGSNPATTVLGNPRIAHNVNVGPGGTLQFAFDNSLGDSGSAPPLITFNVNGGVINGANCYTLLGPVVLSGGTLNGSSPGPGSGGDVFQFGGSVTASGSAASLITGSGASGGCNLGAGGPTTFEVDAGSTLTVATPLTNPAPAGAAAP